MIKKRAHQSVPARRLLRARHDDVLDCLHEALVVLVLLQCPLDVEAARRDALESREPFERSRGWGDVEGDVEVFDPRRKPQDDLDLPALHLVDPKPADALGEREA